MKMENVLKRGQIDKFNDRVESSALVSVVSY